MRLMLLLLVLYGLPLSLHAATPHIDIFTLSSIRVNTYGMSSNYYEIDAFDNHVKDIMETLRRLPARNPDEMKRLGLEEVAKLNPGNKGVLKEAALALSKSYQMGVKNLPAIVFDETYVVYGVNDLSVALRYYEQYMMGHR